MLPNFFSSFIRIFSPRYLPLFPNHLITLKRDKHNTHDVIGGMNLSCHAYRDVIEIMIRAAN